MARQRHLRNAPIREAVIDIRVAPSSAMDLDAIRTLKKRNSGQFPGAEDIWQGVYGFEVGAGAVKTSSDQKPVGIRLTSEDQKCIVQFRSDGFTLSRLPPYETWEAMKEGAEPLWRQFAELCMSARVKRAAVRYINVLPLPIPITELRDYLAAPPEIPDGLPQGISSFFSRIVLPDSEIGAFAIVTQALESPPEEKAQIIFDIDAFKDVDFPASSDDVWIILDDLRKYKNRIFFGHITEKTAELFE